VTAIRPWDALRVTTVATAQSRRHDSPSFRSTLGIEDPGALPASVFGLQQQLEVSAQDIVQARSNAPSASARSAGTSQTSRANATAMAAKRRPGR